MPVIMPVYGTRPEAIKMAPIIAELKKPGTLECFVTVTGQHRSMLDQVNRLFGIIPDHDLNIFEPGQSLNDILVRTINGMDKLFAVNRPDAVVVQGDTTTSAGAALSAFNHGIPVAHVEAGLRSGNPLSPFPEEGNRKIISQIASLHLAPTTTSRSNLLRENVPAENIVVTGNTVIDALQFTVGALDRFRNSALEELANSGRRFLLVTTHRRENIGEAMQGFGRAVARIASANPSLVIVFPAHANPAVREAMFPPLAGLENVVVTEPLEYGEFARLLSLACFVLTDSGGIQEEGPSLGKPVLLMRDTTERPEAVEAGSVRLVGTDEERIFHEATRLLHDEAYYASMASAVNPYGDGTAASRSVAALKRLLPGEPA